MTNHELVTYLQNKNACRPAMEWLKDRDLERMWEECERGDWLIWFAAKVGIDRKVIVRTACACAREALRFVPDGEIRPKTAIETAERWCNGEATIEQVRNASAAAAAADAAAYAAACDAAYAAYAADADAAFAAYAAAAYAAYAAAAYADAAAAAAACARKEALEKSAQIVKSLLSLDQIKDAARKEGKA